MRRVRGSSRTVLLTKKYAFKLPTGLCWKRFLWGLLSNMQEQEFYKHGGKELKKKLCPILFYIPGGFLVVMPKARVLSQDEMSKGELEELVKNGGNRIPAERKCSSFGYLGQELVAVDYGH